jgi:hypothetical protein
VQLESGSDALTIALQLAYPARAVYPSDSGHPCESWFTQFPQHKRLTGDRVFGIVAADATRVFIVFRGRLREDNFQIELKCSHVPFLGGCAHEGYVRSAERMWNPLLAALYDVNAVDKTLLLTGHSGGGCMASIVAERLANVGFDVKQAVTFGAPRFLNDAAANSCVVPNLRIVNEGDMVPRLGWPTMDRYVHRGEAVELLPAGYIRRPNMSSRVAMAMDRLDAFQDALAHDTWDRAHSMEAYFERAIRAARSVAASTCDVPRL